MALPTAVTIPSRLATAGVAYTWTAAPTTPTAMDWMPGDIFEAWNTDGTTPYTVTIVSNPKNSRSAVTITAESLAAGIFHVFPRFPPQDDDTLLVNASNAAIKFRRLSTKAQPA